MAEEPSPATTSQNGHQSVGNRRSSLSSAEMRYENLLQRFDSVFHTLSQRDQLSSEIKSQLEHGRQKIENEIKEKFEQYERKIDSSLSLQIKSALDYTQTLYAKFERMVWLGLVLLAGVAAFVGYQQFSSIPEKIQSEIASQVKIKQVQLDTKFNEIDSTFLKGKAELDRKLIEASQQQDILKQKVDQIASNAQTSAESKISLINVDYENGLISYQVDSLLSSISGTQGENAAIGILVSRFSKVDPTRQIRIVETIGDREIPAASRSVFQSAVENWAAQTDDARNTRYRILIRLGGEKIRADMERDLDEAIQRKNDDAAVRILNTIWTSAGLNDRDDRGFSSPSERSSRFTRSSSFSQYSSLFKKALEVDTLSSKAFPLALDFYVFSASRDRSYLSLLAKAIEGNLARPADAARSIIKNIAKINTDQAMYRAFLAFSVKHPDLYQQLQGEAQQNYAGTSISREMLAYIMRNTIGADDDIINKTIDFTRKSNIIKGMDFDEIVLRNYLQSRKLFLNGARVILADNRLKTKEIRDIQEDDAETVFTPQNSTFFVGQTEFKIDRISIDGKDYDDKFLKFTIDIIRDFGSTGERKTIIFNTSSEYDLDITSQINDHSIEFGKQKYRFGMEKLQDNYYLWVELDKT